MLTFSCAGMAPYSSLSELVCQVRNKYFTNSNIYVTTLLATTNKKIY